MISAILDIPVYKSRIQSLHLLFSLYSEFKNSQVRPALESQGRYSLRSSESAVTCPLTREEVSAAVTVTLACHSESSKQRGRGFHRKGGGPAVGLWPGQACRGPLGTPFLWENHVA